MRVIVRTAWIKLIFFEQSGTHLCSTPEKHMKQQRRFWQKVQWADFQKEQEQVSSEIGRFVARILALLGKQIRAMTALLGREAWICFQVAMAPLVITWRRCMMGSFLRFQIVFFLGMSLSLQVGVSVKFRRLQIFVWLGIFYHCGVISNRKEKQKIFRTNSAQNTCAASWRFAGAGHQHLCCCSCCCFKIAST